MSQSQLIISIASIAAILVAGYFVYYLASIATDLYQLKIEMKREIEERISDLLKQVETRIVDRSKWIRENLREENQRSLGELRTALEEAVRDGDERIAGLRLQLEAVEKKLAELELNAGPETAEVETAKPAPQPEPPPAPEPDPAPDNVEYIGEAHDPATTPTMVAASETTSRRKAKG